MMTKKEKKELEIELNNDIGKSNELLNDFCVYLATYKTSIKSSIGHLTKDEYDRAQREKFVGSAIEKKFLEDLPDRVFVDTKTYLLNKDNFALGFHPMVWDMLTNAERIALCQIARQKFFGKSFDEFCFKDNIINTVYVAKNGKGALNIASFYNAALSGLDVLLDIANSENEMKKSFYLNRMAKRRKNYDYNKVTDFESLEEMQYVAPQKVDTNSVERMSSYEKAIFYDELYKRRYRDAKMMVLDLMQEHAIGLKEMLPRFFEKLETEQKNLLEIDFIVMSELGSTNLKRDEKFVRNKVYFYNEEMMKQYNIIVDEYNNLLEQYQKTNKKVEREKLKVQLTELDNKLNENKAQRMTEMQAMEYFSKCFEKKNEVENADTKQTTDNNKEKCMEKEYC